MNIYILTAIILFILFSYKLVMYMIENSTPYNHEKTISKLKSKNDFNGTKKLVSLTQIETGMSYFFALYDSEGKNINNFSPDWSNENIELWCSKNGYKIHKK